MPKKIKELKEQATIMLSKSVKDAAKLAAEKEDRTLSNWINLTLKRVLNVNTKEATKYNQ